MNVKKVVLVAMCGAGLTACASSGGGGGGGGGGTPPEEVTAADYQALFESYTGPNAIAPTSDLPTSGSANYEGTVRMDLTETANPGTTAEVLGDVALGVTFGAPTGQSRTTPTPTGGSITTQTGRTPVTGTVNNVRGTLADGTTFTSSVEFSTEHAAAQAAGGGTLATEVSEIDANITGVPVVTTTTGSVMVPMGATFDSSSTAPLDRTGTGLLTLGGQMFGPGGEAVVGTAQLAIDDDAVPGLIDVSGSGTFVAERQ